MQAFNKKYLIVGLFSVLILISVGILFYSILESGEEKDSNPEGSMIFVKGGTFSMGIDPDSIYYNCSPVHRVTLSDFYIGKYEVTQGEWEQIIGNNPSLHKDINKPVERVGWYDAIEFCNRKSIREGLEPCYTIDKVNKDPYNVNKIDTLKWTINCNWKASGYRLPTEAEWEYAAKGGDKSRGYIYSGSNNLEESGWYADISGEEILDSEEMLKSLGHRNATAKMFENCCESHKVGEKKPNELGIHDMSGNVFEWCWDNYARDYYALGPERNPAGTVNCFKTIIRGGSYISNPTTCTPWIRAFYDRTITKFDVEIGFRVVRSSVTQKENSENISSADSVTKQSVLKDSSSTTDIPNFIHVEGGYFRMGDLYGLNSENIVHNVELSDFYISKYEVTQKEWYDIMKKNPSLFKGDNLPVECVSWYEAVEYCNKRSIIEELEPYYTIDKNNSDPNNKNENDNNKWLVTCNRNANGYRLPTEAEWEYAARGGKHSKNFAFSGSNDLDEVGWYNNNSGDKIIDFTSIIHSNIEKMSQVMLENHNKSHQVGEKLPNELGLCDMSGNVWEWCWDWYEESYYNYSQTEDPIIPLFIVIVRDFAPFCRILVVINTINRYQTFIQTQCIAICQSVV